MKALAISVVIPTRNPDRNYLNEVLTALSIQTLAATQWEVCLVDNGSNPPLHLNQLPEGLPLQVVREERPGLLAARICGLAHTAGPLVVFIDDDTVPDPGFLTAAVDFMEACPKVGVAGGRILPRYLAPPPEWLDQFAWALALRDNGPSKLEWNRSSGTNLPSWTPIGAGLLVRRTAVIPGYLQHVAANENKITKISWRGQGAGGVEDKDLVLHCLRLGWSAGYAPEMVLQHIIPCARMEFSYFEKLLPALEKMWAQTLHAHEFERYPPIHPCTLPLRKIKAWFSFGAFSNPANRLRWLESCGYLEGLAENHRMTRYDLPESD